MTRNEIQGVLGELVTSAFNIGEYGYDDEEAPEPFEYNEDDEEPAPLMRETSRCTVLSALTTKAEETENLFYDDLLLELDKRGLQLCIV